MGRSIACGKVAEHADACGVTLAVEYLNRSSATCSMAADTVRFVKDVDHPRCRMMYDTFHANIEEKDPIDAIRSCAQQTVARHFPRMIADPGHGNIPWDDTYDALRDTGYDGWLMIEAFGMALPALAAATKIWRRMFKTEEQLAADGLNFIKARMEETGRGDGVADGSFVDGSVVRAGWNGAPAARQANRRMDSDDESPTRPEDGGLSLNALTAGFTEMLARRRSLCSGNACRGAGRYGQPFDSRRSGPRDHSASIVEAMLFVGHPENEPLTSQQMAVQMRGVAAPPKSTSWLAI